MKKLLSLALAIALVLACGIAAAASFPERDITLVNPYEAGGTSDIPSRIYASYISEHMDGRRMNVNCIAGSGGALGALEVMNGRADGYTILVAPAGYAMNYAKGGLEWTYEAFDPVCLYVTSVLCVAVRADSPYQTYEDLVAAVKANPGKINMGIATSGLPQFSVYAMEAHEDMKFNTVDIGGSSVKSTELLAGRVDVMIDSLGGVKAFVESGDFRLLTVFSAERHPAYADVPTMLEVGYTSEEMSVMNQVFGIWAPKGTDPEIIAYIADQFEAAAKDEETAKKLNDQCYTATFMDTAEYNEYLKAMYESFVAFADKYIKK
ncbi:MAG: tripartite tricarboxylate transporter substrate binding protein [Candidatus Ventricola sp.]